MKKIITLLSVLSLSLFLVIPAMAQSNAAATSTTQSNSSNDIGISVQDNRSYDTKNEAAKTRRYFASPGDIIYPNAPAMFGGATPSYMDRMKVKDILEYDEDGISLNMALQMRQDDAFMGKRIMVREKYGKMVKAKRLPSDTLMKVVFTKQADMQSLGTITVVSDSKKSISPDVFAEIIIKAHELGAVAVHVKAEGFQRLVRNEGAGIGFTWTGTTISGGQTQAATGVMGFGKSWGEAGYFDHPFIIVHALFPKGFKIGNAKAQAGNVGDWLKD